MRIADFSTDIRRKVRNNTEAPQTDILDGSVIDCKLISDHRGQEANVLRGEVCEED